MTIIKITNGFYNHNEKRPLLTATLISGHIEQGDRLIVTPDTKIEIIEIEYDTTTFPGRTYILLTVANVKEVIWHTLYGKEFKIEK